MNYKLMDYGLRSIALQGQSIIHNQQIHNQNNIVR